MPTPADKQVFPPSGHGSYGRRRLCQIASRPTSLGPEGGLVRRMRLWLPAVLLAGCCGISAHAAELRLRGECTAAGAVVRLEDVAEIVAADAAEAQRLGHLELFPAPLPPGQRFLTVRELEDLLLLRGINLAQHRISGSSQIVIHGRAASRSPGPAFPGSVARKAQERVEKAIAEYLDQRIAQPNPGQRTTQPPAWQLDFELTEDELRRLWPPLGQIAVCGGSPPWTGPQFFEIELTSHAGRETMRLKVDVQTAPAVVVTTRSLPPGTIIRPSDVRLQSGLASDNPEQCFRGVEEVLGHETTRALPAGVIVQRHSVRAPLLVRRGDVVTVYSRAAGIRVRTTGRARGEAALGELVEVEALWSRETYFARVCGIQEVEVFARPPQATAPSPPAQAGTTILSVAGPVQPGAYSVPVSPGPGAGGPVANRALRVPAAAGPGF